MIRRTLGSLASVDRGALPFDDRGIANRFQLVTIRERTKAQALFLGIIYIDFDLTDECQRVCIEKESGLILKDFQITVKHFLKPALLRPPLLQSPDSTVDKGSGEEEFPPGPVGGSCHSRAARSSARVPTGGREAPGHVWTGVCTTVRHRRRHRPGPHVLRACVTVRQLGCLRA